MQGEPDVLSVLSYKIMIIVEVIRRHQFFISSVLMLDYFIEKLS